MGLAIVYSRSAFGISAPLVTVEVHLSNGLPNFSIVGLPEATVKESRYRVRSALLTTHFKFPLQRITVNLGPADVPKEGGRFDLPIALGILAASGQISKKELMRYEFTGELALSGELRAVRGVLPMRLAAQTVGRILILPFANKDEAALASDVAFLPAKHLLEVCAHLTQQTAISMPVASFTRYKKTYLDLGNVKGQAHAKRALEIAAAGQHSILFIGPPGTGKSMLANRLPSILPELSKEEALEVAAVASVSNNGFNLKDWQQIPFRAPHHTTSSVALVGGGRPPKPGEISLAHRGVLFLDELPEFSRCVLESLREPLESGEVTISRAAHQITFPARFQLIAAMNPCPCGYAGSQDEECRCREEQIERYISKISGPLLDRLDMHVEVGRLAAEVLMSKTLHPSETSQIVAARVLRARSKQIARQEKNNNLLNVSELEKFAYMNADAQNLVQQVMEKLKLSARSYHRIIRVARTIADLQASDEIKKEHVSEALSYRCMDKRRNRA